MDIEIYTYWNDNIKPSDMVGAASDIPVHPIELTIKEPYIIFPRLQQPQKFGYRANNIATSDITHHIEAALDIILQLKQEYGFGFHQVILEGTDDEVLHFETGRGLEDAVEKSRLACPPSYGDSEYYMVEEGIAREGDKREFSFKLRTEKPIKFSDYAAFSLPRLRENASRLSGYSADMFRPVRSRDTFLAYFLGEAREDRLVSFTSMVDAFPRAEPVYHEGLAFGFFLHPAAMFYVDQIRKGAETPEEIMKAFKKYEGNVLIGGKAYGFSPIDVESIWDERRIKEHLNNLARFHVINTVETTTYAPLEILSAV